VGRGDLGRAVRGAMAGCGGRAEGRLGVCGSESVMVVRVCVWLTGEVCIGGIWGMECGCLVGRVRDCVVVVVVVVAGDVWACECARIGA